MKKELEEVREKLANYPPLRKWTKYVHTADEEEEQPSPDDYDFESTPITGDEEFPPELKIANPVHEQKVEFQNGDEIDTYEYDKWRRKWFRINIRQDDPVIIQKHKHYHKHLDVIDAHPQPGDDAWRVVARKEGQVPTTEQPKKICRDTLSARERAIICYKPEPRLRAATTDDLPQRKRGTIKEANQWDYSMERQRMYFQK
jgi:hypothetical protein